jgi:hypothetical protein
MKANADLLSTFNSTGLASSCFKSPSSHTPWVAAEVVAMYSASHNEMVTTRHLRECKLTKLQLRKNNTPEVLWLLLTLSLS